MNVRLPLAVALALSSCTGIVEILPGAEAPPIPPSGPIRPTVPEGPGALPTPGAAICSDDKEFFRTKVYEPVMAVQCIGCHTSAGPAAATRLILQPGSDAAAVDHAYSLVRRFAATELNGESILLLKPTGRHPAGHGGGARFGVDSRIYADLKTFVGRTLGREDCAATAPRPGLSCAPGQGKTPRQLRRLSRFELDGTLRELLGTPAGYAEKLPADTVVDTFDNNAKALRATELFVDVLWRSAGELGAGLNLTPFLSCAVAAGTPACAEGFIRTFGERAFRRPLTEGELARYRTLHTGVSGVEGFETGVRAVVSAMVQSPHFLYRTELGSAPTGGQVTLTSFEVASQLSYFFTGAPPDAALMAAAKAGQLGDPAQRIAQARRLLADPKARRFFEHLGDQWLDLGRLELTAKDPAVLPGFTDALKASMRQETLQFFESTARSGKVRDLLASSESYVDSNLAQLYGLPAIPAGTFQKTALPASRRGLLGQASLLATHATPNSSSPVLRGKWVREKLLCQPLPPPPAGLAVSLPPFNPNQPTRERFAAHSTNAACSSCHQLMDPIGLGFENFDGMGRERATEGGKPVDVSGEIFNSQRTNGKFVGAAQLAEKLAGSAEVTECIELHLWRYAYGQGDDATAACAAQEALKPVATADSRLEDVLLAIVQAPAFTQRPADP
jgi:hypothetical protein